MQSNQSFIMSMFVKAPGVIVLLCIFAFPAKILAERNLDAVGLYNKGTVLYFGQGVEVDRRAGCLLFEKAAALGYGNAIFNLGNCARDGDIGEVDLRRAEELYIEAASVGVANAFVALGVIGVASNNDYAGLATTNQFFKIALQSDPGNSVALFHYGISLLNGRGVKQDTDMGVEHIRRSSAEGYALALAMDIFILCDVNGSDGEAIGSDAESREVCEDSKLAYNQHKRAVGAESYVKTIESFVGNGWLPHR